MRILGFGILLSLSFTTFAESNLREVIDCSSYEVYEQQHMSPQKTYDKEFLESLKYQHWFVPPPPDFESSGLEPMMNTPQVALKTQHGWISGISRGEFGGAIVHHKADGTIEVVANAIVEDIYVMPFGIVVTEGLAHMHSNSGSIVLITVGTRGFKSEKLHGLPGMPETSWKLPNGNLLINTYKNGSVLLNQKAELHLVQCKES